MKIIRSRYSPIFILMMALFGFSCRSGFQSNLPVVQLSVDGHPILAEVANTAPTRMTGLMFRSELGANNGMLFIFEHSKERSFWMKNTLIPLSIAFMDEKGVIENILEMPPQTEQVFMSAGPAQYALEMNAQWFERNGVKPGDIIAGVTKAPKAQD